VTLVTNTRTHAAFQEAL